MCNDITRSHDLASIYDFLYFSPGVGDDNDLVNVTEKDTVIFG